MEDEHGEVWKQNPSKKKRIVDQKNINKIKVVVQQGMKEWEHKQEQQQKLKLAVMIN